jgi:hypothetical protein
MTKTRDLADLGGGFIQAGTGAVQRTVESKLQDVVSVKDFGAVGDGVADDTAAIQAAITAAYNSGGERGVVFLPKGTYRVTGTLDLIGTGVSITGEGAFRGSVLYADFTGGACLRVKGRYSRIENLIIDGNTAVRNSSANDHGILISPVDQVGVNCWFTNVEGVEIKNQGGDGIRSIAATWLSKFQRLYIHDNGGNGFRFDNGEIDGRVNKANPGEITIENVMVNGCVGNALWVGNDDSPSNRGFRFTVNNLDTYFNAEAAGVRKTATQLWAFWDSSTVCNSAFDGGNVSQTPLGRCVEVAGTAITLENNRYLRFTPQAIRVNSLLATPALWKTAGIKVDGSILFNSAGNDLVSLDPTVTDIQVSPRTNLQLANIFSPSNVVPIIKRVEVARVVANKIINNDTVLSDVPELAIELTANEIIQFQLNLLYKGDQAADLKLGFVIPTSATIWWSPINGILTDTVNGIVEQPVIFNTSSTIQLGTLAAGATKVATIAGEIKTFGTAGTFKVQVAQNTANASDTTVLNGSYLEVKRC